MIIPDARPVEMMLDKSVETFMVASGQLDERGFAGTDSIHRRRLRREMLVGPHGEITELLLADDMDDLVEYCDGIVDSMWVLHGSLLSAVGPKCASDIIEEINRSNLSKIDGTYGPIILAGEPGKSKVLKPQGWQPPDVRGVLEKHGWGIRNDGTVYRVGNLL